MGPIHIVTGPVTPEMLTCVWSESEYRFDGCISTLHAYIETHDNTTRC
jgi:hypothetical protein